MSGRRSHAVELALKAHKEGEKRIYLLAKMFHVSASTIYRALKKKKK